MSRMRSVFAQLVLVIVLVLAGAATLALLLGRELSSRASSGHWLRTLDGLATTVEGIERETGDDALRARLRDAGLLIAGQEPVPTREGTGPVMRRLERRVLEAFEGRRDVRLGDGGDGGTRLWLRLETTPPLWVGLVDSGGGGMRRYTAALLAGCVLLVWLAAAYFARRLVQPLRRLAAAAPALVRGEQAMPPMARAPGEVAEVARALSQASREVREAAEERALMLAGISHDLRTPLTRLQYALALLPETDHELQAGMYRDIAEIDAVLSQFIAYARDGRDERTEQADLAQICRTVLSDMAGWRVALPDAAPIIGKPLALRRAVENLVTNAQRHGAAPFALELRREDGAWRVEVADTGPGIADEDAGRVQRPFVRGDGGGSGLGLAIVARIARQHGGELRLLPNRPHGLRAVLSLRGA